VVSGVRISSLWRTDGSETGTTEVVLTVR